MNFKGCIFDLDGTLLDTVHSIARSANLALEKYGFAGHEDDKYLYFAGDGQRELLRRALAESGDEKGEYLERVSAYYTQIFKEGCMYQVKPYPGIESLISELKKRKIKLAVLSNKEDQNVRDMISQIFPEGTFDYVAGCRKEVPRKPDKAGVSLILQEWGIDADACVYVGDTNTDMYTGKNAGAFTVGVTWGFRPKEELQKCSPDAMIDRPLELLRVFENGNDTK